jgi:hypothetical protein
MPKSTSKRICTKIFLNIRVIFRHNSPETSKGIRGVRNWIITYFLRTRKCFFRTLLGFLNNLKTFIGSTRSKRLLENNRSSASARINSAFPFAIALLSSYQLWQGYINTDRVYLFICEKHCMETLYTTSIKKRISF